MNPESLQSLWANRSDEELKAALGELDEYDPPAQEIIKKEAESRGTIEVQAETTKSLDSSVEYQPFWFRSGCQTTLFLIATLFIKSNAKQLGDALRAEDLSEVASILLIPVVCIAWIIYSSIRNWLIARRNRQALSAAPMSPRPPTVGAPQVVVDSFLSSTRSSPSSFEADNSDAHMAPKYAELEELARLRDGGVITEEEFTSKNRQILGL